MHRKKLFYVCSGILTFQEAAYGTIRGCTILYFIEQFCFFITYWYGGVFVMALTLVTISRKWGRVICFQFPWSGWNLYMLNFQLNNPAETAQCTKLLIFFFNVYCKSHSFTYCRQKTFKEFFTPGWNYYYLQNTLLVVLKQKLRMIIQSHKCEAGFMSQFKCTWLAKVNQRLLPYKVTQL
jgi:hypothetical protein